MMRNKNLSTKFSAKLKTTLTNKERSTNSKNNYFNLNKRSKMKKKR